MRIGMLADSYYPYISGVTNHIAVTKKFLEQQGHEVFVFTFGAKDFVDDEPNIFRSPGIPIVDSGLYFGLAYSKENKALVETMDIVHIHHPFISGYIYRNNLKPLNIPGVFTNHTRYDLMQQTYLPAIPEGLGELVISGYLNEFCKECNQVIAPSNGLKKVLQELGVEVDVKVLPNGINLENIENYVQSAPRSSIGFSEDDLVFVYIGRLAPEKNLDLLLQAFSGVASAINEVKLLIVGDGLSMEDLKIQTEELNVADKVVFTGLVDYNEVPKYLKFSDVFITPSVSEVHPLTVLEALAVGLPVVGIQSPGVGDIVEDGITGYTSNNDLASFTAKFTQMAILHDKRKDMALNAIVESKKYSIKRTGQMLLDLYQEVIDANTTSENKETEMKSNSTKSIGNQGEKIAAEFLVGNGYEFLQANYYTSYGELDLIMQKDGRIHICEVKTRSSNKHGYPEEAVDSKKLVHIYESAEHYFQENELDVPWQIDVISILLQGADPKITYIENVSID